MGNPKRASVNIMIINNNIQAVAGAYAINSKKIKPAVKDESSDAGISKDEVLLSTQAQSFSQILQKAKSMPEVRQDKVDTYSAQIGAGLYQIDPKGLADKILNMRF
jgi:negative regulator of flagellin synthesis FlgM